MSAGEIRWGRRRVLQVAGAGLVGAAALAACSEDDSKDPATPEEIRQALDDVAGRYDGITMSLRVYDPKKDESFDYHPEVRTYEGSVVKVPIALTVMRQAKDAGGTISEDKKPLLHKSLTKSDNLATEDLFEQLGGGAGDPSQQDDASEDRTEVWRVAAEAVNETYGKLRVKNTRVSEDDAWGGNETSAADQAQIMKEINQGIDWVARDDLDLLLREMQPDGDESQEWGVGALKDQSFAGSKAQDVRVKNGWLGDDDDKWSANSTGSMTLDGVKYAVALVTHGWTKDQQKDWQKATSEMVKEYFSKRFG